MRLSEALWSDVLGMHDESRPAVRLSLRGFRCQIDADTSEPLSWLRTFMAPHYRSLLPGSRDWRVAYRPGSQVYDAVRSALDDKPDQEIASRIPGGRELLHREYLLPGMRALYNDEFGALCCAWPDQHALAIIPREDDEPGRLYLARSVRKLSTLHHQARGAVVVHAAAFERDGTATLAIAQKGGGKSTYLIQQLLGGAHFVANDRTLLYEQEGVILARGLPNIITLHSGTLALFPRLRSRLDSNGYHNVLRRGTEDGRRRLTAGQLCRLLGAPARAEARVTRVVFISPEQRAPNGLQSQEVVRLLQEAIFDYADRRRVFFSSLSPVDWGRFRRDADQLCERIATTCKCICQGWDAVTPA